MLNPNPATSQTPSAAPSVPVGLFGLSARVTHSVALLVVLARKPNSWVSLSELARTAGLLARRAEVLIGPLRDRGLVTSTKGRTGGYRLSRAAAEITLFDVVMAAECGGIDADDQPFATSSAASDAIDRFLHVVWEPLRAQSLAAIAQLN